MRALQPPLVVVHDPVWKDLFSREAAAIASACGQELAVAVHHIGSTSIPGLCAKPIIDILLEVISIERFDLERHRMETLGYEAKGEFGVLGRRYFRKHDRLGVRTHHVHAFQSGSAEIANARKVVKHVS